MGRKGAEALATALLTNRSLTTLRLTGNGIGDKGIAALCKVLGQNAMVRALFASANGVTKRGAKKVALALAAADRSTPVSALTQLDLSHNEIGPDGCTSIAQAVRFNSTVRDLNLEFCGTGTKGAVAFAEALRRSKTLRKLNITGNGIDVSGIRALGEAIEGKEFGDREKGVVSLPLLNLQFPSERRDLY